MFQICTSELLKHLLRVSVQCKAIRVDVNCVIAVATSQLVANEANLKSNVP